MADQRIISPAEALHEIVQDLKGQLEYLKHLGIPGIPLEAQKKPDHQPMINLPPATNSLEALQRVRYELGECTRCRLHEKRTHIVFGEGSPEARLVFVGEAPGETEDQQARPFVGEAGELLTKIIVSGMKMRREDVYICNVVKCRPPGNRNPLPEEIATCQPFLIGQLAAIKPQVIVGLGKFASQTLLRTAASITRLRGKFGEYQGIPVMPTFHPAYLLYNPKQKTLVWEDIKKVMALLKEKEESKEQT